MKPRPPLILIALGLCLGGGATITHANEIDPLMKAEFEQALSEFDQAQEIQTDQPARARQLFRSAAQRFASIAASGIGNGRLEFNLANCYLQAGDIGRAILHYRRAYRFMPGDPLLVENLNIARSRCLTSVAKTRRSVVLRSVLFWHYQTSQASRLSAALAFYVLVWGILILRSFMPRPALSVAAILCAIASASAGSSVAVNRWADRSAPEGVVIDMDVVVSKGPGSGYQRLFEQPLQPGVEFTLGSKTRSGWWSIELADGKTGWIDADRAELIPIGVGGRESIQ